MKRVIALGFFDGVHLGHGALLRRCRQRADELGCSAAALTFDPHPQTFIAGKAMPLINTLDDRIRLMTELYGMDEVPVLSFDEAVMHMPWQRFAEEILVDTFEAVHVVCGHDYTFGSKGLGTAQVLREFCETRSIGCDIIEKVEAEGGVISSTRIRSLLQAGDVETANRLLGHRHFLTATVCHGKQLGRKLGFPTANLPLPEGLLELPHGVYAAETVLPDGSRHRAVVNIGLRPTVEQTDRVNAECWLPDFDGDLYDTELQVEFCKFLRPEQKFDSVDDLRAAIAHDGEAVRAYFETI